MKVASIGGLFAFGNATVLEGGGRDSRFEKHLRRGLPASLGGYGRFLEANEMVKKLGLEGDEACRWRVISNQAHDRMFKLSTELGLTAVSRKRVQRNRGAVSGTVGRSTQTDSRAHIKNETPKKAR